MWLPDPAVDPAAARRAGEATGRRSRRRRSASTRRPARSRSSTSRRGCGSTRSAWSPVSATASAGAVTVTATATPTSVRWDMGNGDVVVCDGPGTPYDSARTARRAGERLHLHLPTELGRSARRGLHLRVTTTWAVTWTVSGAPGGGSLGTASRTTTTDAARRRDPGRERVADDSGAWHGDHGTPRRHRTGDQRLPTARPQLDGRGTDGRGHRAQPVADPRRSAAGARKRLRRRRCSTPTPASDDPCWPSPNPSPPDR